MMMPLALHLIIFCSLEILSSHKRDKDKSEDPCWLNKGQNMPEI